MAPVGVQLPGVAVRVDPTLAVPVTIGFTVFWRRTSLKWMNPLGQPLVVRVIRAQEKSPPQLSWETMISLADTTRSTYATCPTEPAGFTPAFHHATAPTAGVPFVMLLIALPQLVALPLPVHGRLEEYPLRIIR